MKPSPRSRFFGKRLKEQTQKQVASPFNISVHRKQHKPAPVPATGTTTIVTGGGGGGTDDDSAFKSGVMLRYTAKGFSASTGYMSTPYTVPNWGLLDEAQVGTIVGWFIQMEAADATSTLKLFVNGASIDSQATTITGKVYSDFYPLDTDVFAGDVIQLNHFTSGSPTPNLVVWVYISLDNV